MVERKKKKGGKGKKKKATKKSAQKRKIDPKLLKEFKESREKFIETGLKNLEKAIKDPDFKDW